MSSLSAQTLRTNADRHGSRRPPAGGPQSSFIGDSPSAAKLRLPTRDPSALALSTDCSARIRRPRVPRASFSQTGSPQPAPENDKSCSEDATLPAQDPQIPGEANLNAELSQQLAELKSALMSLSSAVHQVTSAVDAISQTLKMPQGSRLLHSQGSPPQATQGSFSAGPAEAAWKFQAREALSIPGMQNELPVRLQQAFTQARVQGLGRPSEVALEDFVDVCMEAEAGGVGCKELQLQLILAEGALPPPFGKRRVLSPEDGDSADEPGLDIELDAEDMRVRNLWVRFVYSTLATVKRITQGLGYDDVVSPDETGPPDPMDGFVQQTVKQAFEEGRDLDFVLLQQQSSEPLPSPFIRMMRHSQLLILLTLKKGLSTR